jgi:hypothetical protein
MPAHFVTLSQTRLLGRLPDSHVLFPEDEPNTANRVNQLTGRYVIDFTPEINHINVDNVIECVVVRLFPNVAGEHFPGDDVPLVYA